MPINAELGPQLESFVTELVETGRYTSMNEVLREGVRLIQEREARLAELDAAIERGIADADAGRVRPAAEVFDRLEAKVLSEVILGQVIVVFTAEADADLEAIGDRIASDNPSRALSFVRQLRNKCEGLADMPKAFSLVPRYEEYGIRRRVFGDYLVFYRIETAQITVLRILHGATDYGRVLFPD